MKYKIPLIVAACLVAVGLIVITLALSACGWDLSKLSTVKYETNTYELYEDFEDISVETLSANISFVPTDGECKIVCYEQENVKHSVAVKNGALCIEAVDSRQWYEYIGINFATPEVKIYLPEGEYQKLTVKTDTGDVSLGDRYRFESASITGSTGDVNCAAFVEKTLKIKISTGNLTLKNCSVGALKLTVSTGDVKISAVEVEGNMKCTASTGDISLTDVTCNALTAKADTGNLALKNVVAEGKFSLKTDTGDIKFTRCDAAEIYAVTDTGDVTGSLLSEKVFITQTDTGSVSVPKTATGGRCEITTDTGDIKITVK